MSIPRPNIAENPWLWVALFGGMGLLGVIVIGPKFAVRWSRVERMQETRERVALERARREALGPAAANSEVPDEKVSTGLADEVEAGLEREPYVDSDYRQPMSLRYLVLLMTLVMLVGTTGLIVTRGRERRAAELAAVQASNSDTPSDRQA